ncbi:MAG: AAA family ATPase, partial [Nitriliruptorales bacterium]|nr:AAA family ATPase [Nitriliruptorales bacterium]
MLVERDAELVLLGHAVDEAARGGGSLTLIDGAPGTGKSALLQTVRERASDLGHTLLTARGSPEEIEFPYGLVRQLIGPVLRTDMGRRATDNGVAQHALRLVDPASAPQAPVDTTYSMLQGLYWLLSNLSTITPVVVTIDDLHVGDTPSLEFLRFLGNRLDGERIAVVCAGDTSAPAGSLATALLDVAQHTTRLRPLTQEAVGTLVEDTLGRTLAGALAEACHV